MCYLGATELAIDKGAHPSHNPVQPVPGISQDHSVLATGYVLGNVWTCTYTIKSMA